MFERMGELKVRFLEDSAQTAESVASWIAAIASSARATLDLAIYDFHLDGEAAEILAGALVERQRAGVALRILYNRERRPDDSDAVEPGHPDETAAFLASWGLDARPVGDGAEPRLMHHKYLLVDAGTAGARLWAGSANLTTMAFTRQENNLLDIVSRPLVDAYTADFEEIWRTGEVAESGAREDRRATVHYEGAPAEVLVRFAPGDGRAIDEEVSARVAAARREVSLASFYLTSDSVISALSGVVGRGIPISGIVDGEMRSMIARWRSSRDGAWKADAFEELARYADLREKQRGPGGAAVHDFMHDKVIVVDDTVITGSYNYSSHARSNAENILFVESPPLAEAYRAAIAALVRRYPPAP